MMVGMLVAPLLAARVRPGSVIAGGMLVGGSCGFTMLIVGSCVMAAGFTPPEKAGAAPSDWRYSGVSVPPSTVRV